MAPAHRRVAFPNRAVHLLHIHEQFHSVLQLPGSHDVHGFLPGLDSVGGGDLESNGLSSPRVSFVLPAYNASYLAAREVWFCR